MFGGLNVSLVSYIFKIYDKYIEFNQAIYWRIRQSIYSRIITPPKLVIFIKAIMITSQFNNKSILNIAMTVKIILAAILIVLSMSKTYPLFKQCDARWANEQLGTSSSTICKAGCLMSSVAMALDGWGKKQNPSTLNTWLKGHGGYVSGDSFVWGSVKPLGLNYVGKVSNSGIAAALGANEIVILNVHQGGHWVLAHSISGNTISVNDPGYSTTSYHMSEIVANNSGHYKWIGSHNLLGMMISELEFMFNVNNVRSKMMQADGGLIQSQ